MDSYNMDPATEANSNGKHIKFAQANNPLGSKPGTAASCARLAASICIAPLPHAIKPLAQHSFSKFLASKIELLGLVTAAIALHHFGVLDSDKACTNLVVSKLEQDIDLLKHYRVNDDNSVETVLQTFFSDLKNATTDPLSTHIVGTLISQEQKDSIKSANPSLVGLIEALFA